MRRTGGGQRRRNAYWQGRSILEISEGYSEPERGLLKGRTEGLEKTYEELSGIYQAAKEAGDIPLK